MTVCVINIQHTHCKKKCLQTKIQHTQLRMKSTKYIANTLTQHHNTAKSRRMFGNSLLRCASPNPALTPGSLTPSGFFIYFSCACMCARMHVFWGKKGASHNHLVDRHCARVSAYGSHTHLHINWTTFATLLNHTACQTFINGKLSDLDRGNTCGMQHY